MKPLQMLANFFLIILMVSFMGYAQTAMKEGIMEYLDHSIITSKVKTEFFKDERLKLAEINV
jgi:hypothetical protein